MAESSSSKRVVGGRRIVLLLLVLVIIATWQTVRAEVSIPQTDRTPLSPLAVSPPVPAEPDYPSGFALGAANSFAIFYEERSDTTGCTVGGTYRIYTNQTSSGPNGLSITPTPTTICESHFLAKDWPITIGAVSWKYRGWGGGNLSGQHNFYVSNDRINWTFETAFTFPDPFGDQILYGFHDLVKLNGHYIGFAESAGGHTYIVSSTTGDANNWTVVARVGGIGGALVPPDHLVLPGSSGPIPSGNFSLMEVGGQLAYGKLYIPGDRSAAYLIINRAAAQAATPAAAEAAFLDVNDWSWSDGTSGAAPAGSIVLADTRTATSGHNIREAWTTPMSDPTADHVILYVGQYVLTNGTRRGFGCAAASTDCLVALPPTPTSAPTSTAASALVPAIPATGFEAGRLTILPARPAEAAYSSSDMRLAIPLLGVNTSIVGIPRAGESWDVTWLGQSAGYLQGTAFPTWPGNSVIAGHVYNSDGRPGPFVGLDRLSYGSVIDIYAWGQTYIYSVRENRLTTAHDASVFQHEDYSWLTLLTCQGYDQAAGAYKWRRVVRAVLVKVTGDK